MLRRFRFQFAGGGDVRHESNVDEYGITAADLVDGATIVTAANVVEYMASNAATLNF